jgi:hypothetical protein
MPLVTTIMGVGWGVHGACWSLVSPSSKRQILTSCVLGEAQPHGRDAGFGFFHWITDETSTKLKPLFAKVSTAKGLLIYEHLSLTVLLCGAIEIGRAVRHSKWPGLGKLMVRTTLRDGFDNRLRITCPYNEHSKTKSCIL